MGWSSGSEMAERIWQKIKKEIPAGRLRKVAEVIVSEFEGGDADDWRYEKGSVYQVARPDEVRKWEEERE